MLRNALLAVVAVIMSLLAVEGAMRAAGFKPRIIRVSPYFVPHSETTWSVPDPELGWINKQGVSRSLEAGHALMTFWDSGRRASRPDPAPPADADVPVMIVGASDAQSYGVADADSFAYLLGERYPKLWIENFGTGGYSTVQSVMMAKRAFDTFYTTRKPRLILLTFGGAYLARDVADYAWISAISDSSGRYVAPPHFRMAGDSLRFHPFRVLDFWPLESRSAALSVSHEIWLKSVAYHTNDQAIPVTRRVLQDFAAFAADRGVTFAVVTLLDADDRVRRVLTGQPFPQKDCSGLERTQPADYLLGGNGHPNPKLHAVLARCVGEWFDTALLAPTLAAASPPR